MEYELFSKVIFGDTGTIIFKYSRDFAKSTVNQILKTAGVPHSTRFHPKFPGDYEEKGISSIKETSKIKTDLSYRSFCNTGLWKVYLPVDTFGNCKLEKYIFESSKLFCHVEWLSNESNYDECINSMLIFTRTIPKSRILAVNINSETGIVTFNKNYKKYKKGYCPLLFSCL